MIKVASDIMGVKTNQVSESMRHEEEAHSLLLGLSEINLWLDDAKLLESLKDDLLSKEMHVNPCDSGLSGLKDSGR